MKICKKNKAFTLIEIIVVCGIASVFLGTAIMLFTNFRRGYSRSEGTAVLMQEGALLVARLRTDLNSAVIAPDTSGSNQAQLKTTADQLSFMLYNSRDAKILPIVYRYQSTDGGGSIYRREGSEDERELIKDHVASLTWFTELERFIEQEIPGSGTLRISIDLALQLKMKSSDEKSFVLKTSIFPARLNRQLNSL